MKKENLLKQKNGEALLLAKSYKELKKRETKLSTQLLKTRTLLQQVCIHNETKIVNDYTPAGYLDREVYVTKVMCKTCGKELDRKEVTGGFG